MEEPFAPIRALSITNDYPLWRPPFSRHPYAKHGSISDFSKLPPRRIVECGPGSTTSDILLNYHKSCLTK